MSTINVCIIRSIAEQSLEENHREHVYEEYSGQRGGYLEDEEDEGKDVIGSNVENTLNRIN